MDECARLHQVMGDIELLLAFRVSPTLVSKYGMDHKLYTVLKRIVDGAIYPGDLAKVSFEPPSKISRRLEKLEGLGLIQRVLDKSDTRRVRIELTPGTLELVGKMDEEFSTLLSPALDTLPRESQSKLVEQLENIYALLLPPGCTRG